jgi:hypothetical protein
MGSLDGALPNQTLLNKNWGNKRDDCGTGEK